MIQTTDDLQIIEEAIVESVMNVSTSEAEKYVIIS